MIPNPAAPLLVLVLSLLSWSACAPTLSEAEAEEAAPIATPSAGIPRVRVQCAEKKVFALRLHANGQLRAREKAAIKARVGGELIAAPVEGQYYRTGASLLRVDDTPLQYQLAELRHRLAEAEFKKNDLLVRYGGEAGRDSSVSELQLKAILAQSAYPATRQAAESKQYEISLTVMQAPFSGTAADVQVRKHQQISPGELICTLVNLGSLEVEFSVLEQEAVRIKAGQRLRVRPAGLPDLSLAAVIDIINPLVDDSGLLRVRARLLDYNGRRLFDGMNAEVIIEEPTTPRIVVPKSAVVLRSDKPVVFVYDTSSHLAKWRYVELAGENDTEMAISDGLKEGDLVIVSNNLTLDHDAKVEVERK